MFIHRTHSLVSGCRNRGSAAKLQSADKWVTIPCPEETAGTTPEFIAVASFHGVNSPTIAQFQPSIFFVPAHQMKPCPRVEPWGGCQIPVLRKWLIPGLLTAEAESVHVLLVGISTHMGTRKSLFSGWNGSFTRCFRKQRRKIILRLMPVTQFIKLRFLPLRNKQFGLSPLHFN